MEPSEDVRERAFHSWYIWGACFVAPIPSIWSCVFEPDGSVRITKLQRQNRLSRQPYVSDMRRSFKRDGYGTAWIEPKSIAMGWIPHSCYYLSVCDGGSDIDEDGLLLQPTGRARGQYRRIGIYMLQKETIFGCGQLERLGTR